MDNTNVAKMYDKDAVKAIVDDPATGVADKIAQDMEAALAWHFDLPAGYAAAKGTMVPHRVLQTRRELVIQRADRFGGWETVCKCEISTDGVPKTLIPEFVALMGFVRLATSRREPDQIIEVKE